MVTQVERQHTPIPMTTIQDNDSMRAKTSLLNSLLIMGIVCFDIIAMSCMRNGDGSETIYVTNKTTMEFSCELTIDGVGIPAGDSGPGGTSTATLPSQSNRKHAHMHLVLAYHPDVTSDIDFDLIKVSGNGQDLHFDIESMKVVKVYYKSEPKDDD
jgi:hypothetical protein